MINNDENSSNIGSRAILLEPYKKGTFGSKKLHDNLRAILGFLFGITYQLIFMHNTPYYQFNPMARKLDIGIHWHVLLFLIPFHILLTFIYWKAYRKMDWLEESYDDKKEVTPTLNVTTVLTFIGSMFLISVVVALVNAFMANKTLFAALALMFLIMLFKHLGDKQDRSV